MSQLTYLFSRLATDATGLWEAIRSEVDSLIKERLERLFLESACVRREEFESLKILLERAIKEGEQLKTDVVRLETRLKKMEIEKKV